jgi:hypothetical protein
MDETKGAIFGCGWAFILYQLIFYFWLGYGGIWLWLGAILVAAVGAAAGYFIGKQMSG